MVEQHVAAIGERVVEPETPRVNGELILHLAEPDEGRAEACFLQSLDIAGEYDAKSWELRAATSLARLWRDQGKTKEARDLLAPIYAWFTKGFDTVDLKAAKALLES